MKKLHLILPLIAFVFCLSTTAYAQVALAEIPNSVKSHFTRVYDFGQSISWSMFNDADDVFISGKYEKEGDAKTIYYKNDAYWCLETGVNTEYCPQNIRLSLDSIAPSFNIKSVSLIQSIIGSAYKVSVSKGKKKKAVCKDLYFNLRGAYIKELPCNKMFEDLSPVL